MKKVAAIILGLFGLAAYANAIGYMIIDSGANGGNGSGPTATTGGLVWLDPDGNLAHATLDTNVDINVELLWGPTANSVNNVVNLDPEGSNSPASPYLLANQPTGREDITGYGNGGILDIQGYPAGIPGEAAGSTVWFILVGWTGNSPTPDGPNVQLEGETAPFALTLVPNTDPVAPDTRSMSALVLSAPEPSLPALTALGGAAFALFRRRK
jgi:hypothetical protein